MHFVGSPSPSSRLVLILQCWRCRPGCHSGLIPPSQFFLRQLPSSLPSSHFHPVFSPSISKDGGSAKLLTHRSISQDSSNWDEESNVDLLPRSSHSADSTTNSATLAELEALLYTGEEYDIDLGDRWAKKYLITRLVWTFWYLCTSAMVFKGFVLGLVFVTMHYSGSRIFNRATLIAVQAMRFDGFIVWNYWLVFLS